MLINPKRYATHREGSAGVQRSTLRGARFYEFLLERAQKLNMSSLNSSTGRHSNSTVQAEWELSELLESDPSLSTAHSYLTLLIRAAAGGHPAAQHKLSVAYATGIAARDLVPMDSGEWYKEEYEQKQIQAFKIFVSDIIYVCVSSCIFCVRKRF